MRIVQQVMEQAAKPHECDLWDAQDKGENQLPQVVL